MEATRWFPEVGAYFSSFGTARGRGPMENHLFLRSILRRPTSVEPSGTILNRHGWVAEDLI